MINAFRSYHPLRLVLVATLLLGVMLPVVHMVCSFGGNASLLEREETVVSGWDMAGFSKCYRLSGLFALSMHDVDHCQKETTTSNVHSCEIRPVRIEEVIPVPSTEELSQFLAAQLSFLLGLPQDYLSEAMAVATFSGEASQRVPRYPVSLRILFSSFLI